MHMHVCWLSFLAAASLIAWLAGWLTHHVPAARCLLRCDQVTRVPLCTARKAYTQQRWSTEPAAKMSRHGLTQQAGGYSRWLACVSWAPWQ